MRTANRFLVVAVIAVFGAVPMASSQVQGKATTYTSPNGVIERCVAIAPIPGGTYSEHDGNEEGRLCAIDLYAPSVAMCPKTWSTSPGTLIYDISSGDFANDPVRFERDACPKGGSAIKEAVGELAKHKQSINTVDSSALSQHRQGRPHEAGDRSRVSALLRQHSSRPVYFQRDRVIVNFRKRRGGGYWMVPDCAG
jgi:hypothetical protein